jgi:ribosomal protein S18 acetylase RimI-like enzyme
MNLIIRPARMDDLETLYAFEQGVIAAERPFDPTLKDGLIHYYDIQELIAAPHIELAVATVDDKLVASGYARIENAKAYLQHPKHAYLGFMYTVPEFRGRGINKQIIDHLKNWAIAQQVTELRLEVYVPNQPAITAYEKYGFSKHMLEMRMGI